MSRIQGLWLTVVALAIVAFGVRDTTSMSLFLAVGFILAGMDVLGGHLERLIQLEEEALKRWPR